MNALRISTPRSLLAIIARTRTITTTSSLKDQTSATETNTAATASSSTLPRTSTPKKNTLSKVLKPTKTSSTPYLSEYPPIAPLSPFVPIRPSKSSTHVATLHLRSHTQSLEQLTFFTQFVLRSARAIGLKTIGPIPLPTKTTLITVPRSPFAHKKSQQNFWRKEHARMVQIFDGQKEVVQAWLAFLRKEQMGGVGVKVQLFDYVEVGWLNQKGMDPKGRKGRIVKKIRGATKKRGAAQEDDEVVRLAKELEKELKIGVEVEEKNQAEVQGVREGKEGEQRELKEVPSEEASPEEKQKSATKTKKVEKDA